MIKTITESVPQAQLPYVVVYRQYSDFTLLTDALARDMLGLAVNKSHPPENRILPAPLDVGINEMIWRRAWLSRQTYANYGFLNVTFTTCPIESTILEVWAYAHALMEKYRDGVNIVEFCPEPQDTIPETDLTAMKNLYEEFTDPAVIALPPVILTSPYLMALVNYVLTPTKGTGYLSHRCEEAGNLLNAWEKWQAQNNSAGLGEISPHNERLAWQEAVELVGQFLEAAVSKCTVRGVARL